MEVDLWASRVQSAKHLSALQAARLNHHSGYKSYIFTPISDCFLFETDNHLNMDGSEGEDDSRAYFPCPFCYVEIELHGLCNHLQEEHCFDLKNAVCPLCAANLGKDPIGHFTVQHSHSVKRRKKTQKPGFWSNSSTMLGKDFRELSSFLGSSSISGRENVHDSAPDPLLSTFICNVPFSDPKCNQEDGCASTAAASTTSDVPSTVAVKPDEFREEEYEEKMQRAEFFQQLVLSTIF
ncbi:hypothetical protein RHSIM_Rhsim08G0178100 [Rhododendron simsii]|uniref:Uncharacterized protein n=1 Tax=Rhododendron simsii TaxID=118357 RepID=A0A834LJS1_RHOSS|nr:hypothetical protein RHSIM_Rhsim08G0178100 [Rhododendron simsii]